MSKSRPIVSTRAHPGWRDWCGCSLTATASRSSATSSAWSSPHGGCGSGNACAWFRSDRKSTRLNSSHSQISYAVFCLKKKTLPSLREIPADIPAIAEHLLRTTIVPGSCALRFSTTTVAALKEYAWPGNVRELRNIIERAKILCDQEEVRPEHLNFPLFLETGSSASVADGTIAEVEWRMILDALRRHGRITTAAAKALWISLRTLYNKLVARGQGGPA